MKRKLEEARDEEIKVNKDLERFRNDHSLLQKEMNLILFEEQRLMVRTLYNWGSHCVVRDGKLICTIGKEQSTRTDDS